MCIYLADKGEEVIQEIRSETGGSCCQYGVNVLHLDRVFVDLCLPD